jgi:histone H2B
MPPKAAEKKPSAAKAPATASKAPEKKDAGKKTAATGDKKKRTKARKETYSSYIYKGESNSIRALQRASFFQLHLVQFN